MADESETPDIPDPPDEATSKNWRRRVGRWRLSRVGKALVAGAVVVSTLAGLTGWQSFATRADISRPLAYPEWGLQIWGSGATYAGGGDNPVLISEMAAWIKFTRPWMHALWEDAGVGVSDPDDDPDRIIAVPKARAAFLDAFGYG